MLSEPFPCVVLPLVSRPCDEPPCSSTTAPQHSHTTTAAQPRRSTTAPRAAAPTAWRTTTRPDYRFIVMAGLDPAIHASLT
jgi:hypothetical protein